MSIEQPRDIGERREAQQEGRPLRSVVTAVIAFYVAAALLNGRFLNESAREREFGTVRDMWVAATEPLSVVSTFLGLDHFRDKVENLREE